MLVVSQSDPVVVVDSSSSIIINPGMIAASTAAAAFEPAGTGTTSRQLGQFPLELCSNQRDMQAKWKTPPQHKRVRLHFSSMHITQFSERAVSRAFRTFGFVLLFLLSLLVFYFW